MNKNKPYIISKQIQNYDKSIKLDLNEFDFEHHPSLEHNIINTLQQSKTITHYSNIYSDVSKKLTKFVANYNNIDDTNILFTAGSDDALEYIISKYVSDTTYTVLFTPTYNYCELLIRRHTSNIIEIPLGEYSTSLVNCLKMYEEELNKGVVYIVNPNNPLGTLFTKDVLKEIISCFPNTLFIIDEAYIEFCIEHTCIEFVKTFQNVIITRTFSKAYGLAGLRLGYLVAHNDTISKIRILYNEKNVTQISKVAGLTIFEHHDYYQNIIQQCNEIRESFQKFLRFYNIFYIKSKANFISFYIGPLKDTFLKLLEEKHNIYIRDRSNQVNMNGFVRTTIGKKHNMELLQNIIVQNIHLFESTCKLQYFTPKDNIWNLKYLFKIVLDVFQINNMCKNYWLDSGTLLGVYRNNGMIPWDDDIDIAIEAKNINMLQELREDLQKRGLRLKRNRTNCYFQIDYIKDIDNENIEKTNDIHIDIFTFYKHDNEYINSDPRFINKDTSNFKCNFKYTDETLFPLKTTMFYNLQVNIPNKTKNILDTTFNNCDYINKGIIKKKDNIIEINVKDFCYA